MIKTNEDKLIGFDDIIVERNSNCSCLFHWNSSCSSKMIVICLKKEELRENEIVVVSWMQYDDDSS